MAIYFNGSLTTPTDKYNIDDYTKMVVKYTIDEDGLINCDFDDLKSITESHIKKIFNKDPYLYFRYDVIEVCFSSEMDLYTNPSMVQLLSYDTLITLCKSYSLIK